MKSMVSKQKQKVDRLRCDQCGHECSQGEFLRGLNLCDHFALDALVATQLQREERTRLSRNPPSKHFFQNDPQPCSRCQGLMVPEKFIDLESNAQCEGRRCLLCGNVWDRVIADHRLAGTGKLVSQPSVRTIRPMSVHGVSNQDAVRERR